MISPSLSSKRYSTFSTAEKPLQRKYKTPQLPVYQIKREIKLNFQQILNQKCVTFLYMMARRQRIINQEKHLLFSQNKINMLKLFNFIDCQNSEYIDANNLAEYFTNSFLITQLYSNIHNKGKLRFSDFVRMTIPLQYDISLIEEYQNQPINHQLLQKVFKVFKIMSQNQKQNLQQLKKLTKQLKLDQTSCLFQSLFSIHQQIDYQLLIDLFSQNSLIIGENEVSLLFFKLNKNGDGILKVRDLDPYF